MAVPSTVRHSKLYIDERDVVEAAVLSEIMEQLRNFHLSDLPLSPSSRRTTITFKLEPH
jgi:hypothetical protein